jgi:hypothetical protein
MGVMKTKRSGVARRVMIGAGGVVALGWLGAPVALAQEATLTLPSIKDNTLYQVPLGGNQLSNGAGAHFFIGRTAQGSIRRGLLAFDVSSIPQDAMIIEVRLNLNLSRSAIAGNEPMTIHRVLANWGEGTSNAGGQEGTGVSATTGDATWQFRIFPNTTWSTLGGQFVATPSASKTIGGVGMYSLDGGSLAQDVQAWRDNPLSNFGWVLRGNEVDASTAKRFDTRENSVVENRPTLEVVYTTGPTCDDIDFNNDNSFFDPTDIDAFLSVYSEGPCIPASATCGDIDFNNDGASFDPCDIDSFLTVFSEGPCTLCGS